MDLLFNANMAREKAKESNISLLLDTLNQIENRCEQGFTSIEFNEDKFPGGIKLKLISLGYKISGAIRNGGVNKYVISWD